MGVVGWHGCRSYKQQLELPVQTASLQLVGLGRLGSFALAQVCTCSVMGICIFNAMMSWSFICNHVLYSCPFQNWGFSSCSLVSPFSLPIWQALLCYCNIQVCCYLNFGSVDWQSSSSIYIAIVLVELFPSNFRQNITGWKSSSCYL